MEASHIRSEDTFPFMPDVEHRSKPTSRDLRIALPHTGHFRSRHFELPEFMDQPCSYQEHRDYLQDLERVNLFTLAYRPTLRWLDHLAARLPKQHKPLRIVDVGCGFGDMLRQIAKWSGKRGIPVALTGIDINPHSTKAAREATLGKYDIQFVTGDLFSCWKDEIDIVISSLFTHHLPDEEIVRFLSWMEARAARGWFINDLHRHPLPYYGFHLWAKIAAWHPFVQYDGPVSILRSFTSSDWRRFCTLVGLEMDTVNIEWHMPFRLCLHRLKG